MELLIYRHLWGITEAWETLFPRIKDLNLTLFARPQSGVFTSMRGWGTKKALRFLTRVLLNTNDTCSRTNGGGRRCGMHRRREDWPNRP